MDSFKKYHTMSCGIGIRSEKYHTLETIMGGHAFNSSSMFEELHGHEKITQLAKDSQNYFVDDLTPQEIKYNNEIHANVGRPSSISGNQRNAIDAYTVDSADLNKSLHVYHNGGKKPDYAKTAQMKHLDALLDKHTTHEDAMIFTGLRRSPHEAFHYAPEGEKLVKPISHAEYHLPAYTSATSSFNVASKFATRFRPSKGSTGTEYNEVDSRVADHHGGSAIYGAHKHVLAINLPAGSKAQSVRHISSTGEAEHEILMHRGHTLEIHHMPTIIEHDGDKHAIWHANVIDHNPKKIEE